MTSAINGNNLEEMEKMVKIIEEKFLLGKVIKSNK